MYEIYMDTYRQNVQNQVNLATFGNLGYEDKSTQKHQRSATEEDGSWCHEYHYDGIKKSSFFYAQYCYLLNDKRHHRVVSTIEIVCLSSLISLLGTSTDLNVFFNGLSSNLQTFIFLSRSKEEFLKLAASFQLRWNFLPTTMSKDMTLCHRDSFGSWHLLHLLLLEYVIHILQSLVEEEEEKDNVGNIMEMLPDDQLLFSPDYAPSNPPVPSSSQEHESPSVDPASVMLKHLSQSQCPVGVGSMVLRVLGFLVDTATENKDHIVQSMTQDYRMILSLSDFARHDNNSVSIGHCSTQFGLH
ncbi:LOW QUALITY PROTEIN: DNA-binding protein RFX8 [Glossophaga mutica]